MPTPKETTGHHFGDPCIYCKTPHDEVAIGPCPGPRDFRVIRHHFMTPTYRWAMPTQEPLLTRAEADAVVRGEAATGYMQAWVIDRRGLSV
jgi:hypothetical protein